MERRLRWLPERFYFFGILPILAHLPGVLGYRLARYWGRRLLSHETETRQRICQNVGFLRQGDDSWPDPESIARGVFENLIFEDLDTYLYPGWNSQNLSDYFEFEGEEHLREAEKRQRGALLLTAHIGAPAAALVALGIRGYAITHVAREYEEDPTIPATFRAFALKKIRLIEDQTGNPLINARGKPPFRSHQATLEILKRLRRNELVSMALDVLPFWVPETETVSFLGFKARFSSNIVKLAAQTGAPVITYFILRQAEVPHRHRILIQPPLVLSGTTAEDLQAAVDRFAGIVRQHPEQWFSWDSLSHFLVRDV